MLRFISKTGGWLATQSTLLNLPLGRWERENGGRCGCGGVGGWKFFKFLPSLYPEVQVTSI